MNEKTIVKYPGVVIVIACLILISIVNLYELLAIKLANYLISLNFSIFYLMAIDIVAILMPLFFAWKFFSKRKWTLYLFLVLTFFFVLMPISSILIFFVFSDNELRSIPFFAGVSLCLYGICLLAFAFKNTRLWFKSDS